jgi:UPF0755 protein
MLLKKNIYLFVLLLLMITIVLVIRFEYYLLTPAQESEETALFVVRQGATLKKVAESLVARKIIRHRTPFVVWARIMGLSGAIKAGEYLLGPGMSPLKILHVLTKGVAVTHPVTFPEGYNLKQMGDVLEKKGIADRDDFFALTHDNDIIKQHNISALSLEGFLYPDTYYFGQNTSARVCIEIMAARFFEVIGPLKEDIKKSGLSLEEVVTLASIVEKETGCPAERPIIASVFLNRLKKKMRLESDPTVIYGIKDFNGNLRKKDLLRTTPYNTYVIRGLPPGPIANPGKESIQAVIFPANTNYLYFVSKNDGTHQFSRNFLEHQKAVNMYQKRHRKRRPKK